ncbi:hypothetical protein DPMN_182973 [Dreissena polymorpha]|uniref:G-protein coupled receptors family 2 profile 2 domain-containing protein n=1 Tax=Dreissena polymorpha TaxID=45954 RepID=A0A9D4I6N6_DREPO|nr:hypothetical protein DPMN_182973 [Dreissena polymorpha]
MCRQLSCANGYVVSKTDLSRCTPVIKDTITHPEYVHTLNVQLQMVSTKTTRMVSDELTFLAETAVSDLIRAHALFSEHSITFCGSQSFIKLKKPVISSVGDILSDGKFNENIEAFLVDIYFYVTNVHNVTALIQDCASVFKNQFIGHYKMEFISFDPRWFALSINQGLATSSLTEIENRLKSVQLQEAFKYSLNDASSGNAILPLNPRYGHDCYSNISFTPLQLCSRITITTDDVSELTPVSGETLLTFAKVTIIKNVVTFDSYIRMLDGNISVCWEDYREKLSKYFTKMSSSPSKTSTVYGYISLICLSISIASLIVMLSVYLILANLRTLPGLNIMSLSTRLLMSSSLLFANNFVIVDIEWLCQTLGFLLHFTLLSGFCWMFICTFHMMRTLTSLKSFNKNAQSSYRTHLKYMAVAECSAIVLTASQVLVSMLTENTLGYGGRPCYLTNPRSILFFVAIPISIVMVVNLVMYISVIVKIMRLPEIGQNKCRERNNLNIFVKLSTITGLTWIFGIVYELTDVELFSFLFILFNASQGVLIMFSFVINKRVAGLLCKKNNSACRGLSTQKSTRSATKMPEASEHMQSTRSATVMTEVSEQMKSTRSATEITEAFKHMQSTSSATEMTDDSVHMQSTSCVTYITNASQHI